MRAAAWDPDIHQLAITHVGQRLAIRRGATPLLVPRVQVSQERAQRSPAFVHERRPTRRSARPGARNQRAAHVRASAIGAGTPAATGVLSGATDAGGTACATSIGCSATATSNPIDASVVMPSNSST